jgi:hypothetical protein
MSGTDGATGGGRWDDDRLVVLVTEVLDGEEYAGTPAPPEQPAELSVEDVVTAGRAAFCWLDVLVSLRSASDTERAPRQHRLHARAATSLAAPPTGSTTTKGR